VSSSESSPPDTVSEAPYVVAVTGGIASGKSAVCDRLAAHGAGLIDADIVARELVARGQPALALIVERFGSSVLQPDGTLDRRALRERVFADYEARNALNAILHPRVRERMHALAISAPRETPYVVLAIPLLTEVGRYAWIDRVVVVDVPVETQIARLVHRDGISRELALAMVSAQASRDERLAIADDIVVNDGTLEALHRHVDALHEALVRRAATKRSQWRSNDDVAR
jgi:dephospho-CoA kinase